MKIYLAARFIRAAEMRDVATALTLAGHHVVSRWYAFSEPPDFSRNDQQTMAYIDLHDIDDAELLLAFTEPRAAKQSSRGGRHVEFGYALARGKRIWLVGPRENIFHQLPGIREFATIAAVLDELDDLARLAQSGKARK